MLKTRHPLVVGAMAVLAALTLVFTVLTVRNLYADLRYHHRCVEHGADLCGLSDADPVKPWWAKGRS